mgnify:CR=1 FL=1
MNKPFEERLPFFVLGLVVLAIFYGNVRAEKARNTNTTDR